MTVLLALIAAVAENGVIGAAGGMPWRLSSDLKRFRRLTMGKPVIMGRKTFRSIGKPLDGRDNIVVTRDARFAADGVTVARSIDQALEYGAAAARRTGAGEVMVIGGGELYAATIDRADRLYITEVHAAPDGDTRFPAIDPGQWQQLLRERHLAGGKDSADFSFVDYART